MSPRFPVWIRLACVVFVFGVVPRMDADETPSTPGLTPGMTFSAVDTLATGGNDTDDAKTKRPAAETRDRWG